MSDEGNDIAKETVVINMIKETTVGIKSYVSKRVWYEYMEKRQLVITAGEERGPSDVGIFGGD